MRFELTISPQSTDLAGQYQRLSFEHFSDIEIEEVDVENSLNDTSDHSDRIEEALGVISVDPVEDVETAIHSQHEQIVTSDCFSFSSFRHHEQLRKNCASLKVDGESPENLSDGEGMVYDQSQDKAGSQQELNTECIVVTVVRRLELHEYQIASSDTAGNVDDLHAGVVERDKAKEKVQISSTEHHSKQSLGLA